MIDLLSVKIQDGTVTRHNVVKMLLLDFKVAENLRDSPEAYVYQLKKMKIEVDFCKDVGLLTERSAKEIYTEIDRLYSWREEIKEHDS